MKRLTVKIGEYEKNGQTKGRYQNIGVLMENDKGMFLLLDPTVSIAGCLTAQNMTNHKAGRKTGDRLMVSVFDDSNQGGGQNTRYDESPRGQRNDAGGYGGAGGSLDDDVPFMREWRV